MSDDIDPSVEVKTWNIFPPFWRRALLEDPATQPGGAVDLERDELGVMLLAEGTTAAAQTGAWRVDLIEDLREIEADGYPPGGFILKRVKARQVNRTTCIEAEAPYTEHLTARIAAALLWWRHRDQGGVGPRMPVGIGTFARPIVAGGGGFMLGNLFGSFAVEISVVPPTVPEPEPPEEAKFLHGVLWADANGIHLTSWDDRYGERYREHSFTNAKEFAELMGDFARAWAFHLEAKAKKGT